MKTQLFFILLFFSCAIKAQTFEKELEAVYKNFVSADKISYSISYVLKESHSVGSRIISHMSGRYIKDKEAHLSSFNGKTTLVTPAEVILVNSDAKQIRVKKRKSGSAGETDIIAMLKEYAAYVDKVTRQASENNLVYHVQLKNEAGMPASGYEISINKKTNYIEQVSVFYKKPLTKNEDYSVTGKEIPRMDIIFSDYNSSEPAELTPAYYYTRSNNKLSATTNFKEYDIKEVF